ncbi:MAG: hypothetical protein ACOYMD_01785 [Paludibacter sp.]
MLHKKIYYILVLQFVVCMCGAMQLRAADVREIAFLHTDRNVYIAGETAFYKLYVLDSSTKKGSISSKIGYILMRASNSNIVLKIRVSLNAGLANGNILLPDTLTSGTYQIVAFTNGMKNFAEKDYFYKEIIIANRFDKDLNFKIQNQTKNTFPTSQLLDTISSLNVEKQVYSSREKVIVSLEKTKIKANVSVSVYEIPTIQIPEKTFVETLNGLSDISNEMPKNNYLPETRSKIIRGRVIDDTTKKPISGATILLSCPDTIANLQYSITKPDGTFELLLNNYYDGKDLFFTIKDKPANQLWKIEIEDKFSLSEKWNPALTLENTQIKAFIAKSKNIVYINKSYRLNDAENVSIRSISKSICPQLYNCSVHSVFPSDFVSLKDFPEIVVELLPLVRMYKRNNKYVARVINASISSPFHQDPAIFLDGVFLDDINKIIGLESDMISKIDVFGAERVFGNLVFQGVISIITKSNEILKTKPAYHSLRIKNDINNESSNIVNVTPNAILNNNTPFIKQLLYWNPNLLIDETNNAHFEFYTSDNKGNFLIKVEGIGEDGTPISQSANFQVNNNLK